MRALLLIVACGMIAVIYSPPHLFGTSSFGARSGPFYALLVPFALLPNGAGKPLATAFALGLVIVAILMPWRKSKPKKRDEKSRLDG